ncbi:hypothetical protein Q9R46_03310 [Paenibacillus sp. RRE4]|uniref:hypothetical protein n=1 Tax=Paenibacillus sp. RRE4 TaxID=2962587 RepID=UPI0028810A9D|nr:hypothetical protein [Paenibacillus sp. RRE4]MDT0121653.1 hypothetical protein [Paenibacillus sp. RRE4]
MNSHSASGNLEADEELQKYIKKKMTTTTKEKNKKKKQKKRKRIITGGFCEYGKSFSV